MRGKLIALLIAFSLWFYYMWPVVVLASPWMRTVPRPLDWIAMLPLFLIVFLTPEKIIGEFRKE